MKGMGPSGILKASFDWLWVRHTTAATRPLHVPAAVVRGHDARPREKPFISKKLRERTHLYGQDMAAMLAAAGLRPEKVPPECGGPNHVALGVCTCTSVM